MGHPRLSVHLEKRIAGPPARSVAVQRAERQEWNARPLLRCGLCGWRAQGAQKQDQLPALLFGQTAEGGHAASGIAVGDFPEQRAIALRLDDRLSQVGRMFVRHSAATGLVTLSTVDLEQLLASAGDFRGRGQRVAPHSGLGGRVPTGIWFIGRVLGQGAGAEESEEHRRSDKNALCAEQIAGSAWVLRFAQDDSGVRSCEVSARFAQHDSLHGSFASLRMTMGFGVARLPPALLSMTRCIGPSLRSG